MQCTLGELTLGIEAEIWLGGHEIIESLLIRSDILHNTVPGPCRSDREPV